MLRRLIGIQTIVFVLFCIAITNCSVAQSKFPYPLSSADIPSGFKVAGPFTKEEKSISISANRGIVTNKELIANIYERINVNAISRVYVTSYVPGKHSEDAIEVYIIECKSKSLLDKEQLKLTREKGCRYLEKGNYLFIVWSAERGFPKQIDAMAEHLKKKWNLTDISA